MTSKEMIFEQIPVGSQKNFSYLFGDPINGNAVIFDPAWEVDFLYSKLSEYGLTLEYIINTHTHFDHIEGNHKLKDLTGAKVIMHKSALLPKDLGVSEGQELCISDRGVLKFLHTPGHSPESMCIQVVDFALVTGDTLFIGECGRVDLPGGDANQMYDSFEKLRWLDPKLIVYPGHDYGKTKSSTLQEQLDTNYTLARRSREEFLKFMSE